MQRGYQARNANTFAADCLAADTVLPFGWLLNCSGTDLRPNQSYLRDS